MEMAIASQLSLLVQGLRRIGVAYGCSVTRQAREEWGHFQGHFAAGRGKRQRRGFNQFDVIVPGVDFDSTAQRQGCDLVKFVGI